MCRRLRYGWAWAESPTEHRGNLHWKTSVMPRRSVLGSTWKKWGLLCAGRDLRFKDRTCTRRIPSGPPGVLSRETDGSRGSLTLVPTPMSMTAH